MTEVKRPKRDVRYGNGSQTEHCALCRHFLPPHECQKVVGPVNAGAWCELFARKGKKDA